MQELSQIWWKEITGPKSFVSAIAARLSEESVIVRVPDDLPWRHEMRMEIQSELLEQNDYSEISVIPIDAETDIPENQNVDLYILERFALQNIARQYRKKSGKTITQYIVQNRILQNAVLWVKGISQKTAGKWISFLLEYSACKPERGRIVLELREDICNEKPTGVTEIAYSSYISEFNLELFCSILLDRTSGYTESWKSYISALTAILCETDAEIAEYYISDFDHQAEEPAEILSQIARNESYARRGAAEGANHILSLSRRNESALLKQRIWKAQLRVLFPIIETVRVNLIARIYDELDYLLQMHEVRQFGEEVESPHEFEWGTLHFAMTLKDYDGRYYLKSLTKADRDLIHQYREYRNTLAHGDCCTVDQVREILGPGNYR